jgi:hypothetical protein
MKNNKSSSTRLHLRSEQQQHQQQQQQQQQLCRDAMFLSTASAPLSASQDSA